MLAAAGGGGRRGAGGAAQIDYEAFAMRLACDGRDL